MQVGKWGDSLAVRLPAEVVESLGLKEGDEVDIHAAGARALEVGQPHPDPAVRAAAMERIRSFQIELPPDYKFDRDEANAR